MGLLNATLSPVSNRPKANYLTPSRILATKYPYMAKFILLTAFFLSAVFGSAACHRPVKPTEDAAAWQKIHLDFKKLDADGLAGPASGKVAVNYEFCIPREEKYWRQVQKIDTTAQKSGSKGRIGCRQDQWLVIGATHQARYQRVLYELAALPYVERIEETFWE